MATMIGDLRVPVTAPPAQPPAYSLDIAAPRAELPLDAFAGGYVFDPEQCGPNRGGVVEVECAGGTDTMETPPAQRAHINGTPFAVYQSDECSTLGMDARDWDSRINRMMNASRSYWLARQLVEGLIPIEQRKLASAEASIVADGSGSVADTIAWVEHGIAEQGRGSPGQIHVPAAVFSKMASDTVMYRDGTLWRTAAGNTVIMDAGYRGVGPGATEPEADGTLWVYGTSMIMVQFDRVIPVPATFAQAKENSRWGEMVDRDVNLLTLYAYQLATYKWDECVHVAAPVNIDGWANGS